MRYRAQRLLYASGFILLLPRHTGLRTKKSSHKNEFNTEHQTRWCITWGTLQCVVSYPTSVTVVPRSTAGYSWHTLPA